MVAELLHADGRADRHEANIFWRVADHASQYIFLSN